MWSFKPKPISKTVEARARYGGVNLLLTVNATHCKLSMNGGVFIKRGEADDFTESLNRAIKEARQIWEKM